MSQPSYLQSFIDANASFISSILLDPIVKHYEENPQDEISKEKLLEILKMPMSPTLTSRTPQRVAAQPLATAAPKRARKAAGTSGRPQCKWFFTKGANVGKQCTSSATEDSEYCSACKGKRGAGGPGRKTTGIVNENKAPARTRTTASTTAARTPPRTTRGALTQPKQEPVEEPVEIEQEVKVDSFGMTTDEYPLVIDCSTGFILKEIDRDNGIYTVVGICDNPDEDKVMRPLTPTEKTRAKELLSLKIEEGVEMAPAE